MWVLCVCVCVCVCLCVCVCVCVCMCYKEVSCCPHCVTFFSWSGVSCSVGVVRVLKVNEFRIGQGCSVRGSDKSLGSRAFTHLNEKVPFGVRAKFDNFLRVCQTSQLCLSKLQGTAAPPSSVSFFPCSKSKTFNDLCIK